MASTSPLQSGRCSCWIGGGWCSVNGPWVVGDDGRIEKREGGVSRRRPHLSDDGKGVNRPQLREGGVAVERQWHPMTMPELREWFRFLSARLRHVRILNGDWRRAVTNGATKTLNIRQGGKHCGIFLDPPYAGEHRVGGLYASEDLEVAHAVRDWCLERGDDPQTRIVLAGFDSEHTELADHGWREVEWYRLGFLRGGMGNLARGNQQHRERLWLSPHCLTERKRGQIGLFALAAGASP